MRRRLKVRYGRHSRLFSPTTLLDLRPLSSETQILRNLNIARESYCDCDPWSCATLETGGTHGQTLVKQKALEAPNRTQTGFKETLEALRNPR